MRRGFSIVPERVDDQFCLQYLYIYVSSVGQISPLAGLYRHIIRNMNTHYEWCEKCELSFFISFINLDSLINGPLYRFCHPLYIWGYLFCHGNVYRMRSTCSVTSMLN